MHSKVYDRYPHVWVIHNPNTPTHTFNYH